MKALYTENYKIKKKGERTVFVGWISYFKF